MRKIRSKVDRFIAIHTGTTYLFMGAMFFIISFVLLARFGMDSAFYNPGSSIDPSVADQYGSFIGGFIGTMIGISTTLFLIYSIVTQVRLTRVNQIESAFYKLIDYHKDNVASLCIEKNNHKVEGREVFILLGDKFDKLLELVKQHSDIVDELKNIDIAYKLLFFGFSNSDKDMLRDELKDYLSGNKFDGFIQKISHNPPSSSYNNQSYSIIESNQHQLGHYFRNLINIISMIDGENYLTEADKKFYMKILRTQLSTPEVWILFINSLSTMGSKWKEKSYISKYEMIKNLPTGYKKKIDFTSIYKDIEYEFNS